MAEYNVQINKYNANNADYDQLYPQAMKHGSTHLPGGTDPIGLTAADVGARPNTWLPTPREIGAAYSQRSVTVGSSHNFIDGWYKVGTIDLNETYLSYSVILAVQGPVSYGSGILEIIIRTEATAGELQAKSSKIAWLAKDSRLINNLFALDASNGSIANLYIRIAGAYIHYNIGILSEKYGIENEITSPSRRKLTLIPNYGDADSVVVEASITQTLISNPVAISASQITAGTFGQTNVMAANGTDYTTARVRNIQASTTDLTAGVSPLANGTLYLVYE